MSSRKMQLILALLLSQISVIQSIDAEQEPDDETEKKVLVFPEQWPTWWTVLRILLYIGQGFSSLCAVIFLSALLTSPKVRNVSYNLYLVLLVIPDLLLNFSLMITAMFKVDEDGNFRKSWTEAVIWFATFYYTANFWVNFIIAYQIYNLVKKSYNRIKVAPPSTTTVLIQGLCVYTGGFLIATWCALDVPWSPMSASKDNGLFVFQSPAGGIFSKKGTYIFIAAVLLIPTIYVLYVALMMWVKKLLPTSGRTRGISLYFFRILFVFFAFYYPIIVIGIVKSRVKNPNLFYVLQCLSISMEILQALATMHIARQKSDIRNSINELLEKIMHPFQKCFIKDGELTKMEKSAAQSNSDQGQGVLGISEDDVCGQSREQASALGKGLEELVWNEIEKNKVNGGNDVEDGRKPVFASSESFCEKSDRKTFSEEGRKGGNLSLFTEIGLSQHKIVISDLELNASRVPLDRSHKTASEARKSFEFELYERSEASMDSYDSDFQRLNDGLKHLDAEAEEIMEYLQHVDEDISL